ncbi:GntR family transcriptional regulator [Cellulomonas sp. S1-8]|uniref:GntR family transcriptional regulator n=1 Tax=Cellulomonas sp. S1-8 TaxID=2904790 RepID=UPI002243E471|nr:GntR family transcriptional regulator [Cellulomonas sp. S1-8]UZN04162.1 GntR family transcriptional regulator [Cellulomonas sp. S1-8]
MPPRRSSGAPVPTGGDTPDGVYQRIYDSILERRLPPGTKLPEEKLAAIFGVSRARIRKVLAQLEHDRIVEVFHNRGAFVSQPGVEESQHTLEARRIIEPAIVQTLAELRRPADVAALRQHIACEYAAIEQNDKSTIVRLSVEFHNVAAELAGNTLLVRTVRELTVLTSLIILLYDAPTASACLPDDHVLLTDAIEQGDSTAAAEIMLRHLKDVETSLVFEKSETEVDLTSIFG